MSPSIRVNASEAKGSTSKRKVCASVMATQVPQSAFYQSKPTVKASCDGTIKAGAELATADEAVNAAQAALRNARKARNSKRDAFDSAFNVCVAQVEQHATSPEDVTSVGLAVLDRRTHDDLAPPIIISAVFDAARSRVRVSVTLPPGAQGCLIEVTTNPTDPASYRRVPGTGTRRTLSGYAPGTHWFRALSVRANEESAPTAPVSVIVK